MPGEREFPLSFPTPSFSLPPRRSNIYRDLVAARKIVPQTANAYLVALTDGADTRSRQSLAEAEVAIAQSPWSLLVVGLEVDPQTRARCERLAAASAGGMYMHAADAGSGLDDAFAAVAAQFVMPKVKSADAAAAGGGALGA